MRRRDFLKGLAGAFVAAVAGVAPSQLPGPAFPIGGWVSASDARVSSNCHSALTLDNLEEAIKDLNVIQVSPRFYDVVLARAWRGTT